MNYFKNLLIVLNESYFFKNKKDRIRYYKNIICKIKLICQLLIFNHNQYHQHGKLYIIS